jgi:hypothetical protein
MGIFEEHRSPREVKPSRSPVAWWPARGVFRTADLEYLSTSTVIQISYTLRPNIAGLKVATRIFNEEESDVVAEDLSGDR